MTCKHEECEMYPYYGAAPHECYWRKPGGFEANPLGTSSIIDVDRWPANFLAEIDGSEPVSKQISWGLCGVYFCPHCADMAKHESASLWSAQRIQEAIANEHG